MCGRYELHAQPAAIALAFGLPWPPELSARYNIAPMQSVPVVRLNAAGERELAQVRWGLVPRWARDPSIGSRMINARGETAAIKPSFRTAFRRHRCLLPADAFYEWQPGPGGTRQPMRIGLGDGGLMGFAGLYERWLSPEGEPLDTCTILTTGANALLSRVHDRMPVIVDPAHYAVWLDPACPDPAALIRPYPAERMTLWPVSTRVNSVRNDDPSLIEPVALSAEPEAPPSHPRPHPGEPALAKDQGGEAAPAQAKLF
jgi:putative SOS response-associated peptidase YedK